jgi:hypothetical protein
MVYRTSLARFPLYPRKQTSPSEVIISALGQQPTSRLWCEMTEEAANSGGLGVC